jgi:hypothetical protein
MVLMEEPLTTIVICLLCMESFVPIACRCQARGKAVKVVYHLL